MKNDQRTGLDVAWAALAVHRQLLLGTPGAATVAEAIRLRQLAVAIVEATPLQPASPPTWGGLWY